MTASIWMGNKDLSLIVSLQVLLVEMKKAIKTILSLDYHFHSSVKFQDCVRFFWYGNR